MGPVLAGVLLVGTGCTADPTTAADSGLVQDEAPGDSGQTEDPALSTAEDVGVLLQAAIDVGLPAPQSIRDAYLAAMASGDDICPGDPGQLTEAVPPEGCTADTGWYYRGISTYVVDEGAWILSGDFEIVSDDGRSFMAGGAVAVSGSAEDDGWNATTNVGGTWSFDGEGDTLGLGTSGFVDLVGVGVGQEWSVLTRGCVSTGEGRDLCLLDVQAATDDHCGGTAHGGFEIRDELGRWYTLDLSDCTGCGRVFHGEAELGEVCVDLTGLGPALRDDMKAVAEGMPLPPTGEAP